MAFDTALSRRLGLRYPLAIHDALARLGVQA